MAFEIFKESYTGQIRQVALGKGDHAVTVGGETCYPFYRFEGDMPTKPRIAMEIWDMAPEDWPESALAPFKAVVSDPAAWAKKCVEDYGADMIVLQLKSTDPNTKDAGPDAAVATVKKVLAAIDVPLIIWGTANVKKDEEVLKQISEACQGANLTIGPVEDKNHKGIGASAMGYGHTVIASSPIDVNLAKQVNILLENLGMPADRMLIDPTSGGLGYGLEYSYSVMERIRMAALAQGDDKLQLPIINNLGNEIWKCKEAKQTFEEAPTLGDPERRGILMEAVGAVSYLVAGSDILIMRHPEAVRLVKAFIDLVMDGGSAAAVDPIQKVLGETSVDLAALAPAPDLTIPEEVAKKAAPAKKAEPAKAAPKVEAAKAAAAKPAAPKAEKKATPEAAPAKALAAKAEAAPEEKAAPAAQAEAAAEANAKVEADAKAKAETEAKAKAEADAKAEAQAAAKAKREAEEGAIRAKRAKEREGRQALKKEPPVKVESMTPAVEQKSTPAKMLERLKRIHRKVA